MAKRDNEGGARDLAGLGASPGEGTPAPSPRVSHTMPEEIPPVHVLEAAQEQDRKETEDLISGFDRPSRGPKRSSPQRDFVDYYAKKKSGPDSGPIAPFVSSRSAPTERRDVGKAEREDDLTLIKTRLSRGVPVWLAWTAAAALMLLFGGVVAYLATAETPSRAAAPTAHPAATTLTAGAMPVHQRDNTIPPPEPVATTPPTSITEHAPGATDTAASGDPRRRDRGANSAARTNLKGDMPSSSFGVVPDRALTSDRTDDRKPPPRDDFIRDL